MINILEPRYHDRCVLIARYKIPCGKDIEVNILRGSYKGLYKIKNEDICKSPVEGLKTRAGKMMPVRAVSLDKLERVEEWVK